AARLVFTLLLFLRAAALRLGVRAEVAAARRRAAWGAAARVERTRTAERSRRARREAAGTRTREAAGARRTAGSAIFARARFADGEGPSGEHLPVETLNRLFGVRAIDEFDKGEPARAPGFGMDREHDLRRRRDGTEIGAQVGFGRAVSEITDEQTDGQATHS